MNATRKNILYQAFAQGGSKILMFVAYMLLARILGPELYGIFDYSFAYTQIIGGIFFDLGLTLIIIRELSTGNTGIFSPALRLKGLGSVAGCVIIACLGFFLHLSFLPLLFLTLFTIGNSFTNTYLCVFRAKNKMYGEPVILVIQRIFLVLILFLFYYGIINITKKSGIDSCSFAFAASAFLGFIFVLLMTKYNFPDLFMHTGISKSANSIKTLASETLPLIGVSVFWLIYYKIDIVLLGLLSTKEQVGLYSASYKIMEATFVIPVVIMNAIYPTLSRLWDEDPEKFSKVFRKTALILISIGIIAVIATSLTSSYIIRLLYGPEFLKASGILIILIVSSVAVFAGHLVTQSLVIIGRQNKYLLISILAALCNIILNLFFIPLWQAKGAALSTVITETIVTCLAGIIIIKAQRGRKRNADRN